MNSGFRVLTLTLSLAASAAAQTPPAPQGQPPQAPAAQQPDYHPSMGDLMTMAVQPRHIKLWLAGRDRNWTYAAYELSELKGAFSRIGRTVPQYRGIVVADAAKAATDQPLADLDVAIKAADSPAFNKAYAALTDSCNACHHTGEHPMVVIRIPTGDAFPDQDFRPAH